MHIIADENIPLVQEFFSELGTIETLPGRSMTQKQIQKADVLLVRSITNISPALLEGSKVRFVATATIGCDHIDQEYLAANNIGFANAPGCNANSVVEYVLSVLSLLADQEDFILKEKTVGIIGAGNVGRRLKDRLQEIGIKVLVNDPPRALTEGAEGFTDLDELLGQSDIISMHTPLIKHGDHPTLHLLNETRINKLKPETVLINSGRGSAVDTVALKRRLQEKGDLVTVLDVWESEPDIDYELLELVDIGTPHIAGYSLDGKLGGTEMVYRAVCGYFGLPARKKLGQLIPEPPLRKLSFSNQAHRWQATLTAIRACYDVRNDDMALRRAFSKARRQNQSLGQAFDELRRTYPVRREFDTLKVQLKTSQKKLGDRLEKFGFSVRLGK
ncbi:4-phosphoerythronate dehydrogenase PdxB [Oceanospirillum sp.]|uniref:4-phosphoerythronate dehydrogenase PdxB n=1 Tax=Oceanospirillum sp. TaxID=2021254 RepID=UPI003A90195F